MKSAKEIAQALGLRRCGINFHGQCPSCGYSSGFTVSERQGKTLIHCFGGGCTQIELVEALREHNLWGTPMRKWRELPAKPAKIAKDETSRIQAAESIWFRSCTALGTTVRNYLLSRGITLEPPDSIRFLENAYYDENSRFPAMVAAIIDVNGQFKAVHRTFLALDGQGKANVPQAKKILGPSRGASVHLGAAGATLIISEGIETGLSVMQATSFPVWAALSTGGIMGLVLPPLPLAVDVVIAADADSPGLSAAKVAAKRWYQEGRKVKIVSPSEIGCDFNDILRQGN